MRILFVTEVMPDDNGAGSPRRAAQHLRRLATLGEVTTVLPIAAVSDEPGRRRVRALGSAHLVVRTEPSLFEMRSSRHERARSRLERAYHALRYLPYQDGRAERAHRRSYACLSSRPFELVFAFRMQSALWFDSVVEPRKRQMSTRIVDFDDIESISFRSSIARSAAASTFWDWKMRSHLRWIIRTENALLRDWDAAMLCSALDAGRMKRATGHEPSVVPNAVSFRTISKEPCAGALGLIFVGSLSYAPNTQGIMWFVDRIWPKITAMLDEDVSLSLVGYNPPPAIIALSHHEGVTVIGNAPDLDPHYARANIVIAPILAGSGTRIKIIEAAAKGRAIVTTTIGCEGLDLEDGVHAEIADTPEAFANAIVRLARDPARRRALAEAARAHCEARFSVEAVERDFLRQIKDVVAART